MLSETNAHGTRSFVYDGQNRLVSSVDRNERVREFGYDAGGRFTQERWVVNGVVTHTIDYGYDAGVALFDTDQIAEVLGSRNASRAEHDECRHPHENA